MDFIVQNYEISYNIYQTIEFVKFSQRVLYTF